MISAKSAAIVRATLPAVKTHGQAITREMYRTLLGENPSLANVFNSANQANGEQQQALAASVVAGAEYLIGNTDIPFTDVIERVSNKHASIGIRPDQYPAVGQHLMRAVVTVLGDAVTAEVAAAWDEVYWLFACQLVAAEARLYQAAGVQEGRPWRRWIVKDRIDDAVDVVSFVITPADDAPLPNFLPGQYVSILFTQANGLQQPRQFSLSQAPGLDTFRLTIKRTRATDGTSEGSISTLLVETVKQGDELLLSEPFGDVHLSESDTPVVVISAGIGITPMVSIVDHISRTTPARPVVAVHADRSAQTHPLHMEMKNAGARLANFESLLWYENPDGSEDHARQGLVEPALIPLPKDADIYMCGSLAFMRHVRSGLIDRGVDESRIRYEVFGPDLWATAPDLN